MREKSCYLAKWVRIMKDLSIVIPTKNNGDILEKCLRSIQNLNYPKDKMEISIVDGNFTDNTVEIAKKYECKALKI